eukprot:1188490-Prorocentrum_minimum.AAC.4
MLMGSSTEPISSSACDTQEGRALNTFEMASEKAPSRAAEHAGTESANSRTHTRSILSSLMVSQKDWAVEG